MLLPIRDSVINVRLPITVLLLIAGCIGIYCTYGMVEEKVFMQVMHDFGTIPANLRYEVSPQPLTFPLTLISAMFLHGSVMHLAGNLYYLWIFGDNVEERMGPFSFLLFYLVCGIAAGLSHVALNPMSVLPAVGASGAISGVLGAYLVLFPRSKIQCFGVMFGARLMQVPAGVFLLGWFALQLYGTWSGMSDPEEGGVAFMAHVGGFWVGAMLGMVWPLDPRVPTRYEEDFELMDPNEIAQHGPHGQYSEVG